MKAKVLFLIALMSLTIVNANDLGKLNTKRYNNEVSFTERGIEFHIFLDGGFDFNTNRHYNGVNIERDYDGKIRRVGNVFVNYDYYGNVNRIGTVFLKYRRGHLRKVGGLAIDYDAWGNPHFRGCVKPIRRSYYGSADGNIHVDIFDYDNAYFYRDNFRRNYRRYREDDNFYYYRATPNAKIGSRSKILKRRKNRRFNNKTKYSKGKYRVKKYHRPSTKTLSTKRDRRNTRR